MSFILDALKKSEQERRRREVPDLHTEHAPIPAGRSRIPLWALLVGLALLLNAGLLLWWLRPWQPSVTVDVEGPQLSVVEPSSPAPAPAPVTALPLVAPEPTLPEAPPSPPAVPSAPAPVAPAPVREVPASAPKKSATIPDLQDLPAALRAELPTIDITLHFFTEPPAARMVRINGRNLREGQQVSPALALEEITSEGVVLNFRGQLFSLGR
jgi:general secretion pathway protein B